MPRPIATRKIDPPPTITWFKPVGVPMKELEEVVLTLDEVEAIRLADAEGFYQEKVAEQMDVSRQTVGRILASGRKKVAEALVGGKAIRLDGGVVCTGDRSRCRPRCGRRKGRCQGRRAERLKGGVLCQEETKQGLQEQDP